MQEGGGSAAADPRYVPDTKTKRAAMRSSDFDPPVLSERAAALRGEALLPWPSIIGAPGQHFGLIRVKPWDLR
jgi:hypothetical protein